MNLGFYLEYHKYAEFCLEMYYFILMHLKKKIVLLQLPDRWMCSLLIKKKSDKCNNAPLPPPPKYLGYHSIRKKGFINSIVPSFAQLKLGGILYLASLEKGEPEVPEQTRKIILSHVCLWAAGPNSSETNCLNHQEKH